MILKDNVCEYLCVHFTWEVSNDIIIYNNVKRKLMCHMGEEEYTH